MGDEQMLIKSPHCKSCPVTFWVVPSLWLRRRGLGPPFCL